MSYALITGASSGIGLCYAKELANRGYNIVAVSNQEEQLKIVESELRTSYGVEVLTLCKDLTDRNAPLEIYNETEGAGLEVEILICNAGMLLFSTLTNTIPERLPAIIDLHCTTTTLLCRYFGDTMKERRKGHILIMSSSTAWLPYPTISHYSATKAYIKNFAFALWYELNRYGVSVTAVFPGAVNTPFYKLSDKLRSRLATFGVLMSPERVASSALRAMFRGRRRLIPGLFTRLVVVLCALLPARVLNQIIRIKPIRELLERV
ncbi:MAG: SDR family NAD(P)-dependent oxidoreductase [Alistipes sp.]|nr:SDR family NAD(P)-dependent oxidoreductase [Alistipes sp.]MBR5585617.1 SDR family NAD(P)-dependent oxidoreductase [Alistipes sp.]